MERPNLSPLFARRDKVKLRLILIVNLLLQLTAFAALGGYLLSPFAHELPYVPAWSPWVYVSILCGAMFAMVGLVMVYAKVYYRAEREVLEKGSSEQSGPRAT